MALSKIPTYRVGDSPSSPESTLLYLRQELMKIQRTLAALQVAIAELEAVVHA